MPSPLKKLRRSVVLVGVGVAAGYLLDPERGAERRRVLAEGVRSALAQAGLSQDGGTGPTPSGRPEPSASTDGAGGDRGAASPFAGAGAPSAGAGAATAVQEVPSPGPG